MLYKISTRHKKILFFAFFILLIQFLLTFVQGSETKLLSESHSIISLNGEIIMINNSTKEINKFIDNDDISVIGSYSYNFTYIKEIVYLSDSSFIIFGLCEETKLCYQICYYINSILSVNNIIISININFDEVNQYHIHCSSNTYCVVALTKSSQFLVYEINLNSKTESLIKSRDNLQTSFVQCDSFDIGKVFCIFGLINRIVYNYIDNLYTSICDNCLTGSIAKSNVDSINKFLVCYQQSNIKCQYYVLSNNNNNIEKEDKTYNDVYNFNNQYQVSNCRLILKIHNYSIFLKISYYFINEIPMSELKLMSLDFKLKIDVSTQYLSSLINFFIDNNKYYDYDFYFSQTYQSYRLKIDSFLQKNDIDILYFSLTNNSPYDFTSNHSGHSLSIALDPNTEFYRNNIRIINNNQFNVITINEGDSFSFAKPDLDILTNYYCFNTSSGIGSDFSVSISLIGKIQLKKCYDSCKECNIALSGTYNTHYCTQCNNNYYPFYEMTNSTDKFNCYQKHSDEVSRAYLSDEVFYFCDNTCNSCENENDCLTCAENHYFKVYNNNTPIYTDHCYNDITPFKYYFDKDAKIVNKNNEIIQSVYKPCYDSCATCYRSGTLQQNNCDECYQDLIKYKFSSVQCLLNTTKCLNDEKFWKLENNNITCISSCNKSIISEGQNKGQCISDCKNYLNPFLETGEKDINYLTLTCQNLTYCIPYQTCNDIGFTPSRDGLQCLGNCEDYSIFEFDNISEYINSLPVPVINITKPNMTEKLIIINRRKKRIETYKVSKNYEEVIESFGYDILADYDDLFRKQNANSDEIGFLITSTTYDNFTISIYPLDIENYAYEYLFYVNNLGFINFTKAYPDFLEYEVDTGELILVCVMEYFTHSYSMNDLNYFIYSFDELSNTSSFRVLQTGKDLPNIHELYNESKNYEILYPLYNFKNSSVLINKRNSEYLVDNIKQMYKKYPEVNLFDIKDKYYNDICFLFESDVGTDMTLNDRRNEYYINHFLCEENCTLLNIINRDTNPRAVCSCEKKSKIIFNDITKAESEIGTKSSPTTQSIKCFTQTYNIYIGKNPIFWVFMIIIIYQIYFLTMYLKYQTRTLDEIFGISENNLVQNSSGSISSSIYSKIIINNSSKNKESFENSFSEKGKSSSQEEKKSAPVNVYNPPKRQNNNIDTNKSNNIKTNDKDLISKSDSTFLKDMNNKINYEASDISYSDIKNGFDMVEVNNLVEQDSIMENNFLKSPLQIEKVKKMKKIKRSMNPLKEDEKNKYFQTVEDILYSNENKHKFKNKKNKSIANHLGGTDIINKNLIDNLSEDENKPRYPRNKVDPDLTSEKYRTIGSDHIIFHGGENKNNTKEEENFNIQNNINNNEGNLDILFATKKSSLGSFVKSLGKKEVPTNEKKASNKIIKTEEDLDMNNNKIKHKLLKIEKSQKNRPNSSYNKFNNPKYKKLKETKYNNINNNNNKKANREVINIQKKNNEKYKINLNKKILEENDNSNSQLKKAKSPEKNLNENNKIKPKKIRSIKLKNDDENHMINNIDISDSNNKEILIINKKEKNSSENKEGTESKRIIQFQEETEIEGDKVINKDIDLEKLKQKRTQNLELLNDQVVVSSVVEFLETESKELLIEDNFILFYWKYFIKRELGFIVIRNKKNAIPYFVRYSCLGFCISFLFLLNCLFFVESFVHERYINALDGVNINISYYFKKEFATTLLVSFIGIIFKMIVIKLILYRVFKIGKNVKKMMRRSAEKGLTKDEIELLNSKRENFKEEYKKYLIIYFSILMGLTIFIGYICTCYGGVYKNSINAFLFGILFTIIFSFIFCAVLCFLIVGLYKIGKITNSKCAVSAYIVLSTLY